MVVSLSTRHDDDDKGSYELWWWWLGGCCWWWWLGGWSIHDKRLGWVYYSYYLPWYCSVCYTKLLCDHSSDVTIGMIIIHQSTPYQHHHHHNHLLIIIPWYNRALLYEQVLLYHSAHSVYEWSFFFFLSKHLSICRLMSDVDFNDDDNWLS